MYTVSVIIPISGDRVRIQRVSLGWKGSPRHGRERCSPPPPLTHRREPRLHAEMPYLRLDKCGVQCQRALREVRDGLLRLL